LLFVCIGCLLAPILDDPKFGGVFQYIQQFQGYIWPGVVAVFLFGMLVKNAPGCAGVVGLLAGPIIYGLFQFYAKEVHFLIQVAISFQLVLLCMGLVTFAKPLKEPKELPVREGIDAKTAPEVKILGVLVVAAVVIFYIIFW
jgi:solute:Na+ symporter, SSS family